MKKQILIFATITTIVFTSCSKEKIETPQQNNSEEISTARAGGGGNGLIPVSNKGLLGRFDFNGNLKDATGQLKDGYSNINRAYFTTDRKGQFNSAIRFNAAYGVNIYDVPSTPENASFSVWIKHDTIPTSWILVLSTWKGFSIQQMQQIFFCNFWNNLDNQQSVSAYPIDNKWHHVAATRDLTSMKLYVDGVLIGSSPTPKGASDYEPFNDYKVGYGGWGNWKGSMDDLRFYSRVLTPGEISTLATQ